MLDTKNSTDEEVVYMIQEVQVPPMADGTYPLSVAQAQVIRSSKRYVGRPPLTRLGGRFAADPNASYDYTEGHRSPVRPTLQVTASTTRHAYLLRHRGLTRPGDDNDYQQVLSLGTAKFDDVHRSIADAVEAALVRLATQSAVVSRIVMEPDAVHLAQLRGALEYAENLLKTATRRALTIESDATDTVIREITAERDAAKAKLEAAELGTRTELSMDAVEIGGARSWSRSCGRRRWRKDSP